MTPQEQQLIHLLPVSFSRYDWDTDRCTEYWAILNAELQKVHTDKEILERFRTAWYFMHTIDNPAFHNWLYILQMFENSIWLYPVLLTVSNQLFRAAAETMNGETVTDWDIDAAGIGRCCRFMLNIARCLYSKGFDPSIPNEQLEDDIYAATDCALRNEIFTPSISLTPQFSEKLNGSITEYRFRKGFRAIAEMSVLMYRFYEGKDIDSSLLFYGAEVAAIVTERNLYFYHKRYGIRPSMNTLGNLLLMEKQPFVRFQENWEIEFTRRLRNSHFYCPQEVGNQFIWTPDFAEYFQEITIKRITDFLEGKYDTLSDYAFTPLC